MVVKKILLILISNILLTFAFMALGKGFIFLTFLIPPISVGIIGGWLRGENKHIRGITALCLSLLLPAEMIFMAAFLGDVGALAATIFFSLIFVFSPLLVSSLVFFIKQKIGLKQITVLIAVILTWQISIFLSLGNT